MLQHVFSFVGTSKFSAALKANRCAASTRLDVRTASEKTARLDITEKFRPEMFHAMKAVFAILQMAMEAERDRLGKEAEGIQLSGTED